MATCLPYLTLAFRYNHWMVLTIMTNAVTLSGLVAVAARDETGSK